jgi:peptidoglycan hydrolase CwlO-like protein
MKGYEFSCKKMREFMKKEKNVTEKLKLLDKVQEENLRQKEEIKRLNTNINQLKGQIITLNGSI